MTTVLDVVGLAALATAAFLTSVAFGCAAVGVACLLLSWRLTRGRG